MTIKYFFIYLPFGSLGYLFKYKNKRLIIDHRLLLLVGFVYYWILPALCYNTPFVLLIIIFYTIIKLIKNHLFSI